MVGRGCLVGVIGYSSFVGQDQNIVVGMIVCWLMGMSRNDGYSRLTYGAGPVGESGWQ